MKASLNELDAQPTRIQERKDQLVSREATLVKELEQIWKEIQDCDQELADLPETVGKTKVDLLARIRQVF